MKKFQKYPVLFFICCFASACCLGQFPPRTPTINDTLQSVRVGADNRVTFSIFAPKASEVTVGGDFTWGPGSEIDQKR